MLVINIVASLSHAALWMQHDNVLTDTLFSNPKLSSLIFQADTRGLRSTSRCTTLKVSREVLWVFPGGFFVAGILLPLSSVIHHVSLSVDTRLVRDSPCGVSSLVESWMAVMSSCDKI